MSKSIFVFIMTLQTSSAGMYHNLFNLPLTLGHLSCFQLHNYSWCCSEHLCTSIFVDISLGRISRSQISEATDMHIVNFDR